MVLQGPSHVERIILPVGSPLQGGSSSYRGILGRPDLAEGKIFPPKATTVNFDSGLGTNPALFRINLEPRRLSKGPPQALAIAPDSAIAACDIYLGGDLTDRMRHRITPSAPLIMDLGQYDTALVSPIFTFFDPTNLGDGTGAAWRRQNFVWDSNYVQDVSVLDAVTFPLRLNLYHGDARPTYAQRAPLKALLPFTTKTTNGVSQAADKCNLWAIVDGRARFDVYVDIITLTSGTPLLDILSIEPNFASTGFFDSYALVSGQALAVSTPVVKSYAGNPMQAIRCRISGSECEGVLKIEAWDS